MTWTTFELTVTTPLFNGDDPTTGLSVTSMRGVLHYWFRALAAVRAGNDLTALAEAEQAVFGSTKRASPVRMRLSQQPTGKMLVKAADPEQDKGQDGKWVGYLLGQGLATYKGERFVITRPHTKPGHTFKLRIGFGDDDVVNSLFLASLWLACTYGGFGARTRKGFGGVRLKHTEGPLPGSWDKYSPDTPGLEYYRTLEHLPAHGPFPECTDLLSKIMREPKDNAHDRIPDYPALGPKTSSAAFGKLRSSHWRWVTNETGLLYREFRASKPHPKTKRQYEPKIKTPEHETVVHGRSDHFPLGALGLPVNYQAEATVNVFQGKEQARRASPLWLRFVGGGKEELRLFSFAFLSPFLPPNSEARVFAKGKVIKPSKERPVRVSDTDVRQRIAQWMELTKDHTDPDQ